MLSCWMTGKFNFTMCLLHFEGNLKLKRISVSENLVFTPEPGFVSFTLSDLTPWSSDPGSNGVGTHQADIFSPHTLPGGIQLPSVFMIWRSNEGHAPPIHAAQSLMLQGHCGVMSSRPLEFLFPFVKWHCPKVSCIWPSGPLQSPDKEEIHLSCFKESFSEL